MKFTTIINSTKVEIPAELLAKYDIPAPRYTSYPTAPIWTDKFTSTDYSAQLKHLSTYALKHLSLYFHIPFCEQRCYYCGCSTIATTRHDVAKRYVEALKKEIELVCKHLDTKRPVTQLHLGGGTPTFLSCEQMEDLWRSVASHFKLDDNAEIGIEVDPRVTSDDQLKLLAQLGFNRISLGVQDFSDKVQNAVGRIEPYKDVKEMIEFCRSQGFDSVNVDLIYGLPYQTIEGFGKTIEKIIKLSPDRIACFNFAYLPETMPHQRILPKDALPDRDTKFAIFCQTIEQLCSSGYEFIGMDHFAKKSDELAVAAREKTLWRNFQGYTTKAGTDLIGFGLTAISDVAGCYAQNEKLLTDYYKKVEDGKLATIRGWKLSEDDLACRKIIRELFCNGNVEITNALTNQRTNALEKDGLIRLNGNQVQITPLGRLFIRNIAMAFDKYLPEGKTKFSRSV